LRVALIDKGKFPRAKTCGDAIPGPAINALENAFPFFEKEFLRVERQHITSSKIMLKKGRSIVYQWKLPAYNIKREIFDTFLFHLVKKYAKVDILTEWEVDKIIPGKTHLIKSSQRNRSVQARMLIACDGVNSIADSFIQRPTTKTRQNIFAVRAYFKDVNLSTNTNFFWITKKYLPGYFWAFPISDGEFNVGFGMKMGREGKTVANMKEVLEEYTQSERMKPIFSDSSQITTSSGAFIPIGGKKASYSGDAYLLAGDAANLADPLQGHGIDKAIVSGLLAARQAMRCFEKNDFSAEMNADYDTMVKVGLERELRMNWNKMQLLTRMPYLLDIYSYFK